MVFSLAMTLPSYGRRCEKQSDGFCASTFNFGRGGGTRTRNRWFWKPVLCQLSYTPSPAPMRVASPTFARKSGLRKKGGLDAKRLFDHLRHHSRPDGPPALANGESKVLSSIAMGFCNSISNFRHCRRACTFPLPPKGLQLPVTSVVRK